MLKKIIIFPLIVLVVLASIFVTVYLLNYNRYNVSQIGKTSFLIMDDRIDNFEKNDLVLVKKNNNEDIMVGDYVFFYDTKSKENLISYGKVNDKEVINDKETTFTMSDNFLISSEYVIGKGETSTAISNLGMVLKVLSSQLGFLFLVIFPVTILFIYQIYIFILEMKKEKA